MLMHRPQTPQPGFGSITHYSKHSPPPHFKILDPRLDSLKVHADIEQLLDEVEHDIMNYQNRGLCYLPKPKAEADNTDTRV